MIVHSALPEPLTAAATEVLDAAGIAHVAHGDDPMAGAEAAASDGDARIAAHVREQGQRALVVAGAGAGERAELLRALRPERQL